MSPGNHRYFLLNKPYNMVSQFVSSHQVGLLGDLDFKFPEGTHAVGRLDNHSEGLLLLTTNKKVTRLLFQANKEHKRTYLVQVNNTISEEKLDLLRKGILIRIKTGETYITHPCEVNIVDGPGSGCMLEERRTAYAPFTWLSISVTEGKYHQVRKMIGAIHHRCKRLVRISIENLDMKGLMPGEVKEIGEKDFFDQLNISGMPK